MWFASSIEKLANNNMKISFLNGQGIDGVGSTKFMIEFMKQVKINKIVNFISNNANYANAKNFILNNVEVINTNNILNELEDSEIIIVNSFPNNKSTLDEINSFYNQLREISLSNKILVGFMHFNTIAYFNKMPKILYGINLLDKIFVFNNKCKISKLIKEYLPHKENCICEFGLPYTFKEDNLYDKKNTCVYMGRFATFKKPELMLNLAKLTNKIKFNYYGIGRTIEAKQGLLDKENVVYKKYNEEDEEDKVNIRGIYKNDIGINIMKNSMFGFSGFTLNENDYGNRLEYAMNEMIDNQCVCIFSKHCLESVKLNNKSIIDYNIFLYYDLENDNSIELIKKMEEILNNNELRIEIIKNQLELSKELHNPMKITNNILSNINKTYDNKLDEKELIKKLLINNKFIDRNDICYDIPDIKNKKINRIYEYRKTRLIKTIINEPVDNLFSNLNK